MSNRAGKNSLPLLKGASLNYPRWTVTLLISAKLATLGEAHEGYQTASIHKYPSSRKRHATRTNALKGGLI